MTVADGKVSCSLRVELYCRDIDDTYRFWTDVMGFEVEEDGRSNKVPFLGFSRGSAHVGVAVAWKDASGVDHTPPFGPEFIFDVPDLDAEVARIEGAGWPLVEGITQRPWGVRDVRLETAEGYPVRCAQAVSSANTL